MNVRTPQFHLRKRVYFVVFALILLTSGSFVVDAFKYDDLKNGLARSFQSVSHANTASLSSVFSFFKNIFGEEERSSVAVINPATTSKQKPNPISVSSSTSVSYAVTADTTSSNPVYITQNVPAITYTPSVTQAEFDYRINELQNKFSDRLLRQTDTIYTSRSKALEKLSNTELVNATLSASALSNSTLTDTIFKGLASFLGDVYVMGNVGIGTTTPEYALDVNGTARFSSLVTGGQTIGGDFSVTGVTNLATTTISGGLTVIGNTQITSGGQLTVGDKIIAPGEIGLGTSSPAAKLAIQSTNPNQTALLVVGNSSQVSPLMDMTDSSGNNFFHISADGKVGVGTSTQNSKFSVDGDIDITSSLKINGTSVFSRDALQNLNIGVSNSFPGGSGNIIVGNNNISTSTWAKNAVFGSENRVSSDLGVAIGFENVVSSYFGTALGLGNTASGAESTAVGRLNTTGGMGSSAFGFQSSAPGYAATALGVRSVAAGSNSVALGGGAWDNVSTLGEWSFGGGSNILVSGNHSTALGRSIRIGNPMRSFSVSSGGTSITLSGGNYTSEFLNNSTVIFTGSNNHQNSLSVTKTISNVAYNSGSNSTTFSISSPIDTTTVSGRVTSQTSVMYSTAVGYNNIITASSSTVFGNGITNAVTNSTMIGPSDTAKLTILFSGNVGIGTTTPNAKLEIDAAASGIGQIIKANATTPGDLTQWQGSTGAVLASINKDGEFSVTGSRTTTINKFGVVQISSGGLFKVTGQTGNGYGLSLDDYTMIGSDSFQRRFNTDYTFKNWSGNTGSYVFTNDATVVPLKVKAASSQTANLQEWQNSAGTALTVVDANGNVGIGTTTPQSILDIASNAPVFRLNSTNNGGGDTKINIGHLSDTNNGTINYNTVSAKLFLDNNYGATGSILGAIALRQNIGGTMTEVLSLAAGNVGVGTSSPSTKLDVNGTGRFLGNLAVGSPSLNVPGKVTLWSGGGNPTAIESLNDDGSVSWSISKTGATVFSTFSVRSFTVQSSDGSRTPFVSNPYTANWNTFNGQSSFTNNVGIGTTSPLAKLDIYGTAGSADIFAVSSSTNARLFTVAANGRVGIGNVSPGYNLDVTGNARIGTQLYANDIRSLSGPIYFNSSVNMGSPYTFTAGSGMYVTGGSLDVRVNITNGAGTSGNVTFVPSTRDRVAIVAKGLDSGQTGNLQEWQDSNGNVLSVIDKNGNVGIGTTNPTNKLEVNGTAKVNGTTFGNNYAIDFNESDGIGSPGTLNYTAGNGQLTVRATNGFTITSPAGAATLNFGFNPAVTAQILTSGQGIQYSGFGSSSVGWITKGAAGQTADLQRWQNSSGTVLASVNSTGKGTFDTLSTGGANKKIFFGDPGNWIQREVDGATAINGPGNATGGAVKIYSTSNTGTPIASFDTNNTGGVSLWKSTINGSLNVLTGNVGIGTTSPISKLSITQSSDAVSGGISLSAVGGQTRSLYMDSSNILHFVGNGTDGTLNASGAWTDSSDVSYKSNILDIKYGLDAVRLLQPRSYIMNGSGAQQIGFIAQEMEKIIPEVVSGEEGHKGIAYGQLTAVAIQAIKELDIKVSNIDELITNPSAHDSFVSSLAIVFEKLGLRIQDGIGYMRALVVDSITSKEVITDKLCVGDVCITQEEFKIMIQNGGAQFSTPDPEIIDETIGTGTTTATTTDITIEDESVEPNVTSGGSATSPVMPLVDEDEQSPVIEESTPDAPEIANQADSTAEETPVEALSTDVFDTGIE
ncbi:MAG: tail fiber domain-containing protein [Candidatus Paceibacterota bacterium]|jgi:hypothetical protein